MKKVARFILALPIAAPLILVGGLLALIWRPMAALALVGLWLLGMELDFG